MNLPNSAHPDRVRCFYCGYNRSRSRYWPGLCIAPIDRDAARVGILVRIDRIIIVLGFVRIMDHKAVVFHVAVIHSGDRIAAVGECNHIGAGIAVDVGLYVG